MAPAGVQISMPAVAPPMMMTIQIWIQICIHDGGQGGVVLQQQPLLRPQVCQGL